MNDVGLHALTTSFDLSRKHIGALGLSVANRTEQLGVEKAGRPKLPEEGISFLRAGDSREPVGLRLPDVSGQFTCQNQLRDVSRAACPKNASQFSEQRITFGIQIKDAVYKGDIHRGIGQRQITRVRLAKGYVVGLRLQPSLLGPLKHCRAKVHADNLSGRPHPTGRDQ